jgi:L-fuculose-phosphate aldolase
LVKHLTNKILTGTCTMEEETSLRVEIITVCRNLAKKELIAATDGNVSCRVGRDRLLVTPSGKPKGVLKPFELLLLNDRGKILAGQEKPSTEIRMHLEVYRRRPDVRAVVHAHPPMLTALTLAGLSFMAEALPEVWLTLGSVPTAPYATPCTSEVPDAIAPFLEKHQAILLERHGSLTLGRSLNEAYLRLEKLEHAARILFYANLLGKTPPVALPQEALEKLEALKASLNQ